MWIAVLVAVAFTLLYVFVVRPVLVNAPVFSQAFAAEATWVEKIQAKLTGWKTKIASRLIVVAGVVVGLYDSLLPLVSAQDWTPITAKLPSWALPVGLVAGGWLFSYLRHVTENPPTVVTQKTDDGVVQVVAVIPAPAASPAIAPIKAA